MDKADRAKRREIGQRVRAARELRGMSRQELGLLMDADGLGVQDPKRLEQGAIRLERKHAESLARHLRVPATFFVSPEEAFRWPDEDELHRIFRDYWRDMHGVESADDESDSRS